MGLFNKASNNGVQFSQRQLLENKYANSCNNIMLVVVLTVINIVLLLTNSNTYFLFSAYIPFFLTDVGMLFCGMYPAELYTGELADMQFLSKGFLAITLGIAAVILILYVLSWIFSKKQKVGWLIFALVFFSIDTLALFVLNGFIMDSIIDYVIHAWVIISLINGIISFSKLKKLPEYSLSQESSVSQTDEFATVIQETDSATERSE